MGGEVFLRDVIDSDLPVFFEHQRQPEANRMAAFPARTREAFMTHWERVLADDKIIKKTIIYNGQVAGNVMCFELEGNPAVGYWLGSEFWGKGIATRALAEFLEQLKTRPLYAHVALHNIASRRVLEKCGFRLERESAADAEGVVELIMRLDREASHAET